MSQLMKLGSKSGTLARYSSGVLYQATSKFVHNYCAIRRMPQERVENDKFMNVCTISVLERIIRRNNYND